MSDDYIIVSYKSARMWCGIWS